MKLNTNLLPLFTIAMGAMSCAAVGIGGRNTTTIFSDDDPQRFPGENRLQFGVQDASDLLSEAYLEVRDKAARRDLDWCTVLPATTIDGVMAIDQEIRREYYDKDELVRTDFGPAFEQELFNELMRRATKDEADAERWQLRPQELVTAICVESGINYPSGLFLPQGQSKLRDALQDDDDPFEYLLAVNLTGSRVSNETVSFTVECELIPLLDDSDPISAKQSMAVHIPIDSIYFSTGKAKGVLDDIDDVRGVFDKLATVFN